MSAAPSTRFVWGCRLLRISLGSMVVFGYALVVFDNRVVPFGFPTLVNEALWSRPTMPDDIVTYHRFVHAVLGATIASWALALLFVVRHALEKKERWAFACIAASVVVWFVPDTIASIAFGVVPNAVFNVACLATLLGPLALAWTGLGTAQR